MSKYYAIIRFVSTCEYKIIKLNLLNDSKKMFPVWIKCNQESEFDRFFNPVRYKYDEKTTKLVNIVKISDDKSKLFDELVEIKVKMLKGNWLDKSICEQDSGVLTQKEPSTSSSGLIRASISTETSQTGQQENSQSQKVGKRKHTEAVDSQNSSNSKRAFIPNSEPISSQRFNSAIGMDMNVDPEIHSDENDNEKSNHSDPGSRLISTPNHDMAFEDLPTLNESQIVANEDLSIIDESNLSQACSNNFKKIYEILSEIKSQIASINRTKDKSETNICIGNNYYVPKNKVAHGLAKLTIEKYFRELIASGWKIEEKAGHNLTGAGSTGKKKIDAKKLEAFIDYCISSWNEYHNKHNPKSCHIITHNQIEPKRKALRSLMGLICHEENRRAAKNILK